MVFPILKYKKRIFISLFLLVICFSVLFFFLFFTVKRILVISNESKMYGLNEIGNKNILLLDVDKITAHLLNQNPSFKRIFMSKEYPRTIVIRTEERVAVAQIRIGEKKINVDRDGYVVLSSRQDINEYLMPIIMKRNPIIGGNSADALVVKAIRYFDEFEKMSQNLQDIAVDDDGGSYTLTAQSGLILLVPFSEDPTVISSSLQLILTRFRIEGKRVTKVNFLFDKPVITLANE